MQISRSPAHQYGVSLLNLCGHKMRPIRPRSPWLPDTPAKDRSRQGHRAPDHDPGFNKIGCAGLIQRHFSGLVRESADGRLRLSRCQALCRVMHAYGQPGSPRPQGAGGLHHVGVVQNTEGDGLAGAARQLTFASVAHEAVGGGILHRHDIVAPCHQCQAGCPQRAIDTKNWGPVCCARSLRTPKASADLFDSLYEYVYH